MLRSPELVRAFEDEWARSSGVDEKANRAVFAALLAQARAVGALPPRDRLEGIEVDVRLARALHAAGSAE
jgi:hypothetical protein